MECSPAETEPIIAGALAAPSERGEAFDFSGSQGSALIPVKATTVKGAMHKERPKPKKAGKEPPPERSRRGGRTVLGVAKATAEAETETSAPSSEGASLEETSPTQAAPRPEASHAASEERQVEEQFRGPLAR